MGGMGRNSQMERVYRNQQDRLDDFYGMDRRAYRNSPEYIRRYGITGGGAWMW